MKNRLFTIILMLFLSVGILSAAALAEPSAGGTGLTADDPMVVPEEALTISGTILKGISQDWLDENKPQDGSTLYLKLVISDSITELGDGYKGFRLGTGYSLQVDFSTAKNLTKINNQAFMYATALHGELDLSHTKITTLGKSAFSGCTGLTGVILPDTLEVLGAADGSAGSVFNGCSGLQYVRTASGSKTADFELPSNLKVIGRQTFRNAFTSTASIVGRIPGSVEIIGSEAFYSRGAFSQIYIDRQSGYDGYDTGAFKYVGLLILPNNKAYNDTGSFTLTTKTYPVKLNFMNGSDLVATQLKLYGQSIQYTQDKNGIWYQNDTYVLPDPGSVDVKPGYDAGWMIYGDTKVLASTSKVSGWPDAELKVTVVNDAVVTKPTVKYSVNGSVVQYADTGVPELEVAVGPGSPGRVGVQVTHPLATEEARASGTYVYFEYCWWDEVDNGVNGPRSKTEPGLFSTAETSAKYNRVYTDVNEIPIRSSADARTDGDYYMVEIFGYYVESNGTRTQFYKSGHNFIGASDNATDARSYVMNVIATDAVTVDIVPADITVYVGGSGYVGAVDGDGEPLGEDNGFPVPGFTISAEGLDGFDPTKAVLTYQNDGSYYSWDIVPYDGVEGASHGIYRFDPQPGSNTHVKMRFFDEDLNTYVDSDSFDIAGHLDKDFKMEVYGESIEMGYVKLVYGGAEYAVTSGNGTLKVRSTTGDEDYGSVVEHQDLIARGRPGVLADDVSFRLNDMDVMVAREGVRLLFDGIIEHNTSGVSSTQLLINRADEVLGGSSDSRRYEAKYLDLVDTSNGNAWVAADGAVTVYWPLPAGTGWNTNFTLLRFDGLNRETSVGNVENLIATCNVTPIRVENTGTHIKFTVEKAGFAPFILVWDEYNTPITPIPEPDDSPVGLNTEDHVAYIIGYEDGTVRPGANITRAEVATIFFRLLTDETRESYWSQSSGFTDVASGAWYNNAVSTLTRAGILDGYEDGSFRPNASITRAEFTKIAVSFFKHAGGASANPFSDVPDSAWYAEFVKAAAELGLIDGYEDGTFRPNAPITRAEACTIVNRTLGRAPDKDNLLPEHEMLTWPDNSRDAWYYAQIQEATNSHDYQWLGAIELWTAKLAERDWDALEKEWSNAYSAPGGDVVR